MDQAELRRALGSFMTGVTVVTTRDAKGVPIGYTANSFTSVSLHPPLIMVCLGHQANLYSAFKEAEGFAVNILSADQREVSNRFANTVEDRFAGISWQSGYNDLPILQDVCSWFACINYHKFDAGDHLVMIGEIQDFATSEKAGLGFMRGSYFAETIEQKALDALSENSPILAGAIITYQGKILMQKDKSRLTLPVSEAHISAQQAIEDVKTKLHSMGVGGDLGWLYSVEQQKTPALQSLYFHVQAAEIKMPLNENYRLIPMAEFTIEGVDQNQTELLERFIAENRCGRFGVDFGTKKPSEVG